MKTLNERSKKYKLDFATAEDSKELLEIFERMDFKGNISVLFTRRPDPYQSFLYEGEKVFLPILRERKSNKIVGLGCCIVRRAYINGEEKRVGYLTGLKSLPEYRNRVPNIPKLYKQLYEETREHVDIYYTTILKENLFAQKMFEKKRKDMPEYKYCGEYTVYCFRTGIVTKAKKYILKKGDIEGLNKLWEENAHLYNFAAADLNFYGLERTDIYTMSDIDGNTVAACAVWNQQSYKQYIVTGYKGLLKIFKHLPLRFLKYPDLPKENIPVNYACVTAFYVKKNDKEIAECFLKKVAEAEKRHDFLMLGLHENHPLQDMFNRTKHIKYKSRLYTVNWGDKDLCLDDRLINIEVGLL